MSATIITVDPVLVTRIGDLIREIEATEQAKVPVDQEVASAVAHLDLVAARGDASSGLWLSINPAFSPSAFSDSMLAFGMSIAPEATRKAVANHARHVASMWKGLRMSAVEKQRKLTKLQSDLRTTRARLEQQRRTIEARTNETLPRLAPVDDPSIWLLPDQPLAELAATGNGRSK